MTRTWWLAVPLVLACSQDYAITDAGFAVGVPNVPAVGPDTIVDRIVQVTEPEVDVLFVVDNSGSMVDEQQRLADNFPRFMDYFVDAGVDYHIGVVSTDTEHPDHTGRLQSTGGFRWIDLDTPDPASAFSSLALLGSHGSQNERGRRAAWLALTNPLVEGANAGFYRHAARLQIIVVSDADDGSRDKPTRSEFIQFLGTLKADAEMVDFSAVIGVGGELCADARMGAEYAIVSQALDGFIGNICRADWSADLDELGLRGSGLRREFTLTEVPDRQSIEVWVEDETYLYEGVDADLLYEGFEMAELCSGTTCFAWDYDAVRNEIVLQDFVPVSGAEVVIRYDTLSSSGPNLGF